MGFEERVQSIAHAEYLRMLELLQDSEGRTSDLLDKLQTLENALPLLEDIKSEIASIQKMVAPKTKDDEDPKERVDDEGDPTDDLDLLELLEDLTKLLPDGKRAPLLLPDGRKAPLQLPGPGSKGGGRDFINPTDVLRLLLWVQKQWKDLKDHITKSFQDHVAQGKFDGLVRETSATLVRCNQIKLKLDDYYQDISEALSQCCQDTSDKLDVIRQKIDNLSPEADANKDLALQGRARTILAEVQAIRGLL